MKKTEKEHYENGNVHIESELNEKGERHGIMRAYHENGQLQFEITWTNGVQDDGTITSYHDDGSKAREVTLVNHLMNGDYFEWYKNGQLKTQGTYKNKNPTILKEWNEDGLLVDFKTLKFNNETLRKAITEWGKDKKSTIEKYGHISSWDTSEVTDMDKLFKDAEEFNDDIGSWNTAAVTNMVWMFGGATSFNQNIGSWNTAEVTDMSYMFGHATSFNQNIGSWNTPELIDMEGIFDGGNNDMIEKYGENGELLSKKDKTVNKSYEANKNSDKVIADLDGIKIETTFELLKNQQYEEEDDGTYIVYINDGRLDQAVELDSNGFFVETLLTRCKSGNKIYFDSNYKLSKKEQKQVHKYEEGSSFPYVSSWKCYYDSNEVQTFDKKLIKTINEETDNNMGYGSPSGISLQRLDQSDFLKPMEYYW